ncbi:tetratricopeptide repeat protein [Candidatus Poribacteria bacterium]|nr:tetratricopeptide repeat protein [Candidatus Poribacteria bacterium]
MSGTDLGELLDRAELESDAGRYEDAVGTYAEILEASPDHERAQLGFVRALLKSGKADQAFEYLQPRESTIREGMVLAELGRLYYEKERFQEAAAAFQRAVDQYPDDGAITANLGFAMWQLGERTAALRVLQDALPNVTQDALLSANMGQIFMQLGMWNEAVSSLERYLADFPNDMQRRIMLAFCLKNAGWREEAETILREVLTIDPNNESAQQQLDLILSEEPDTSDEPAPAQQRRTEASLDLPNLDLDVPDDTGAGEVPQWDFSDVDVVDELDDSAVKKRVAEALVEGIRPFLDTDDLSGALAYLEQQRTTSEAPAEVLNLLGKLFVEDGDYDAAVATFREAIELDRRHAQAYSNLGVLLWQMGEMDEALEVLRGAIELDAEDFDALANLALICHQCGLHDEAVNLYTSYLEARPEDTHIRQELAECYVLLEETSAALQELDTVLLLEPDNEKAQKRYDELSQQSQGDAV